MGRDCAWESVPGRQGSPPDARCRGEACWQEPGTTSQGMESCPERAPPGRLPLPGRSQEVEIGYLQTPAWPPALPSQRTPDGAPGLPLASAPALTLQDTCSHDGRAHGARGAWTQGCKSAESTQARAMHVSFTFWVSSWVTSHPGGRKRPLKAQRENPEKCPLSFSSFPEATASL